MSVCCKFDYGRVSVLNLVVCVSVRNYLWKMCRRTATKPRHKIVYLVIMLMRNLAETSAWIFLECLLWQTWVPLLICLLHPGTPASFWVLHQIGCPPEIARTLSFNANYWRNDAHQAFIKRERMRIENTNNQPTKTKNITTYPACVGLRHVTDSWISWIWWPIVLVH